MKNGITRGRFLRLETQEPSETTEKVHFFIAFELENAELDPISSKIG